LSIGSSRYGVFYPGVRAGQNQHEPKDAGAGALRQFPLDDARYFDVGLSFLVGTHPERSN
jgi:hypothetical protein